MKYTLFKVTGVESKLHWYDITENYDEVLANKINNIHMVDDNGKRVMDTDVVYTVIATSDDLKLLTIKRYQYDRTSTYGASTVPKPVFTTKD